MNTFVSVIAVIILVALGDALWIGTNMNMYRTVTEKVQRSPMRVDPIATALSYLCLFVLLYCYALPNVVRNTKTSMTWYQRLLMALYYGGGLGLVVYGIYNFTNKALLTNYTWKVAILDTLWGGLLATIVCFVVAYYQAA